MSPDLEKLIGLYAAMHDASAEEQEAAFERLRAECERVAPASRCTWRDVMAFTKKRYFAGLAAEEKREGRR